MAGNLNSGCSYLITAVLTKKSCDKTSDKIFRDILMKDLFNINIFGLIGIKRHEFWIGAILYSDEGFNQNANAQDIFMALKFLLCKIVMIRIHLNSGHSLLRQPSSRPAQCDVSAANFSELTFKSP